MTQTKVSTHLPASIFKTYDIRGIVGQELTSETVTLIGHALGSEARSRGESHLFCGRDGRLSSPKFHQALINGLLASGCDVTDLGCVPTPVMGFAARALGPGNMAMITASHNPPNYNGVKAMLGGESLNPDEIQQLRQRIAQKAFYQGEGSVTTRDICLIISQPY